MGIVEFAHPISTFWATCVSHVSGLTPGWLVVFGAITFAASRARHETSGVQELYRYPPMVGWLMAICGVFFLCIPLLPGRGDVPPLTFFAFFAAFAACGFAGAIYFFRFQVIVDETEFRFGTLRFETIPFAEVVDTDVTAGPRSNLLVYLRDGRRLQFSNTLGDFSSLADSLGARKAGSAPGDRCVAPRDLRSGSGLLQRSAAVAVVANDSNLLNT